MPLRRLQCRRAFRQPIHPLRWGPPRLRLEHVGETLEARPAYVTVRRRRLRPARRATGILHADASSVYGREPLSIDTPILEGSEAAWTLQIITSCFSAGGRLSHDDVQCSVDLEILRSTWYLSAPNFAGRYVSTLSRKSLTSLG
jgi:hypothetical protein